ncbi:hypothetical protein J2X06_001711 [Lysobacter niastensis]|uniref:Uncharacterized protein n=1 Tax=Lysobacter niastensis TaxID=380629 RepID=A0ABU1WAP8_9GAMM|nr:hypothetical protein [Lysobacter niastensis]MDR7134527.1 hypothetical protein [Lysobacter niastensis]
MELLELIDHLNAAVRLSIAAGYSVAPVLERLRFDRRAAELDASPLRSWFIRSGRLPGAMCRTTVDDLHALGAALVQIEPARKAARARAPYYRVLRACVAVWLSAGKRGGYTQDRARSKLTGPLPALARDLFDLASIRQPSDDALASEIRKQLKNLQTFSG